MERSLQAYCEQNGLEELLAQWDPERNGTCLPSDVSRGSKTRVWWRCEKGHQWQCTVASRTGEGSGCPVCAGKQVVPGVNDLTSMFPDVAAQWHPEQNGTLRAEQVSPYSNRRVWWRCELGHEWRTMIAHRTKVGSGCPYCAGFKVLAGFNDLQTLRPEIARQWHPTLNEDMTPSMVMPGSHRKVWWQCEQGHAWKSVVYSRTGPRKSGCPVCAGKEQAADDTQLV